MKTSSPSNTSRGEKELMERKCIRWMMFSIEQNSQALSDARNTKNYIFVSKAKQSKAVANTSFSLINCRLQSVKCKEKLTRFN